MSLECFVCVVDVLLLIKKRPPPTPPKMADVSTDEKVSLIFSLLLCNFL